ncbi:MAG: hypothetical protein ACM30G_07315, partial [Micromonosporaceae bacterium]
QVKPEPTKPKARRGKSAPKARAARARGRQTLRQRDLDHINWVRELVRTADDHDLLAGHPD